MKVLLVQPIKQTKHTLNLLPPLGLGYLASCARDKHTVFILDCVKEKFNLEDFRLFLKEMKPHLVGFTVFSCDLENVRKSLIVTKKTLPEVITVAGGPHPSGDPQGTMDYLDNLDFAFAGEAELGFPLFSDVLASGKEKSTLSLSGIPGLIWREDGKLKKNQGIFVENLDSLKFPSWDLIQPDTYQGIPNGFFTKQIPFAPIIATRGCPYLCTFCSAHNIAGRKLRKRSIENVIAEILMLYQNYRIKEIHIEDDNFTFDITYAKEFCRRVASLNLPLTYSCPNGVRLDRIDEELLLLMKKAGFYNIYVGIESGSERILKHMKKNLNLQEISEKVNLIRKVGLEASAYFILGYPAETVQDIKKTINYARSLKLDWAQFASFVPIPGSEIIETPEVKSVLTKLSWSDYFNTRVPFAPSGMTKEKLKSLQREAFLTFYLRPKQIFGLLKQIRLSNVIFFLRRMINYLVS